MMLDIGTKFSESISKISELQTQTVVLTLWWWHITKGHNYVKTVGGVTAFVLCTSSYVCTEFYENTSKGFQIC